MGVNKKPYVAFYELKCFTGHGNRTERERERERQHNMSEAAWSLLSHSGGS